MDYFNIIDIFNKYLTKKQNIIRIKKMQLIFYSKNKQFENSLKSTIIRCKNSLFALHQLYKNSKLFRQHDLIYRPVESFHRH